MTDCKTLGSVIDAMSNQTSYSHRKPIVVIDAGIANDGNIAMLKNKGYDYMCVSRSLLKEYHADTTACMEIFDSYFSIYLLYILTIYTFVEYTILI